MKVVDLSTPERARVVKVLPDPENIEYCGQMVDLAFWDDYLVVSLEYLMMFYDLSDPLDPQLVQSYPQTMPAGSLDFEGDLGIIQGGNIYPCIVHSPSNIEFLETIGDKPGDKAYIRCASIKNGLIYSLAEKYYPGGPDDYFFRVYNPYLEYPDSRLLNLQLDGEPRWMTVSGGYAYIANDDTGIDILDIDPLSETQIIGSYDTTRTVDRIFSRGAVIIATYGEQWPSLIGGWELFYRDPEGSLHPVFYFDLDDSYRMDAAVNNGYIYILGHETGLHIYRVW